MGEKLPLPVRTGMMLAGILLIGVSVALYRLAAFGVDQIGRASCRERV